MSNQVKRRQAIAGMQVRSYTVYDMELLEQYKQTNEYKKKEEKKQQLIKAAKKKGKVDYDAIHNIVYPQTKYKPRARY